MRLSSGIQFGFSSGASVSTALDTILRRDAANTLALKNSTNAQEYRVYNSDSTDDEFVSLGFINNSNVFGIETEATGAGTIRPIALLGGNVGIGTTTPAQLLSVQGNGLISGNLTLANLIATGTVNIQGQLSASSTATSTFAGGIETATGIKINNLLGCSGTSVLETNALGYITCGSDDDSGGTPSGWTDDGTLVRLTTQTDNLSIGTTTPDPRSIVTIGATSTTANLLTLKMVQNQTGNPFILQNSASSTLFFIDPSGGLVASASSTFAQNVNVTGALSASSSLAVNGLSTLTNVYASASSTFANSLSVAGLLQIGGSINSSSTATSTFAGGISSAGLNLSSGLTITTGSINLSSGATSTFNNGLKLSAGCFEDSTGNCVGKDSSTLGGFTSSQFLRSDTSDNYTSGTLT